MPQSITIAAFVLGAVLLLISLLGGGFKIFGAEVSGNAGQLPRVLAGGLGAVFIAIGLFGSLSPSSQPAPNGAVTPSHEGERTPDANSGGGTARLPLPAATQPTVPNIAGRWSDNLGWSYQFTQDGSRFEFEAYYPGNGGIHSRGSGEINGRTITSRYQIATPRGVVNGTGTGTVLGDGQMTGSTFDPYYGRYDKTLTRVP